MTMTLKQYLEETGETYADFGKRMGGRHKNTIGKWVRRERMPRPAAMREILLATGHKVTPESFYKREEPKRASQKRPVKTAGVA